MNKLRALVLNKSNTLLTGLRLFVVMSLLLAFSISWISFGSAAAATTISLTPSGSSPTTTFTIKWSTDTTYALVNILVQDETPDNSPAERDQKSYRDVGKTGSIVFSGGQAGETYKVYFYGSNGAGSNPLGQRSIRLAAASANPFGTATCSRVNLAACSEQQCSQNGGAWNQPPTVGCTARTTSNPGSGGVTPAFCQQLGETYNPQTKQCGGSQGSTTGCGPSNRSACRNSTQCETTGQGSWVSAGSAGSYCVARSGACGPANLSACVNRDQCENQTTGQGSWVSAGSAGSYCVARSGSSSSNPPSSGGGGSSSNPSSPTGGSGGTNPSSPGGGSATIGGGGGEAASAVTPLPARTPVATVRERCGSSGTFLGLPKWYKYLELDEDTCQIKDFRVLPGDGESSSIPLVVLALIEIALRIGAIIAVAFVVVGGFKFVTSQGEPDGVKSARNTILNAVIGLVITILATPIVMFIGNRFGS